MADYRFTILDDVTGQTVAVVGIVATDRLLVAPDANGHNLYLQDDCALLIERIETNP